MEKEIDKSTEELFKKHLLMEEKSKATIAKYIHDVRSFIKYMAGDKVTKERVIAYKEYLQQNYEVRSVNTILASLNCFFLWMGWPQFRVKQLKIQQQAFCPEEMELTRDEYIRLVKTAREKGNVRLEMIIQTVCCTGIRISELSFITVQAVNRGYAEVSCKAKTRKVMIPGELRRKLRIYIGSKGIENGMVFITRTGKAVDRSNIWREMKALNQEAGVLADKIFPHNLRHLFARSFYEVEKDIAKLADVMGHSSINTTRLYIISTGREHLRQLELLRLVV